MAISSGDKPTYWERRARRAEAKLAEMTDGAASNLKWGQREAAEANRLRDRCTFLYEKAIEHGATRDGLVQHVEKPDG